MPVEPFELRWVTPGGATRNRPILLLRKVEGEEVIWHYIDNRGMVGTVDVQKWRLVKSEPDDPLQTNWTKGGREGSFTGYANPIVNDSGRDPSSAWRTADGEWRIVTWGSQLYGSMDFRSW